MAKGITPASKMKPGSGGVKANAKGYPPQRTSYPKSPAKKPGMSGDKPKRGKSPFGR